MKETESKPTPEELSNQTMDDEGAPVLVEVTDEPLPVPPTDEE